MKTLSVINFLEHYVDDFTSGLTMSRKDYVRTCRRLSERLVGIYLNCDDLSCFINRLYGEMLDSRNDAERKLFSGLIKTIRFYKNCGVLDF